MSKNVLFHLKKLNVNRLRITLAVVLVLLPFAIWLVLINRYGSNLPIFDQWHTPTDHLIAYFNN